MSPFVKNLLLATSLVAVVLGAVRGLAALPHQLHRAGLVAPQSWEQVFADLVERL